MTNYYNTSTMADTHPYRVAYKQFEMDKANCITMMKTNEVSYKLYCDQQERLYRLMDEQKKLLAIMPDDLTGDIMIQKLKGAHA